eukprot:CAMPEP_0172807978 /NCGR_PEP_ID=MMETSP1075-20121228/7377_1 /TAXON_ID=2916 /ORGANISM="Ceratium fusus, Strain PA161109" /LENGTH=193 /DNA_ID=CAMNT_0013647047 /DNA_START=52 /DNA_END=633 /DNA_ORIENTATION=+
MGVAVSMVELLVWTAWTGLGLAAGAGGMLFASAGLACIATEGPMLAAQAHANVERLAEAFIKEVAETEKTWIKVTSAIILAPFALVLWMLSFLCLLLYRGNFSTKLCMQLLSGSACVHLVALFCMPHMWWITMKFCFPAAPAIGWAAATFHEDQPSIEVEVPSQGADADGNNEKVGAQTEARAGVEVGEELSS